MPQDSDDESSSELLKKIAREKVQLIKDGKIKSPKDLKTTTLEKSPRNLPKGWEWTRLGRLFSIVYGKGLPNSNLTDHGYQVFGANGIIGFYSEFLYKEPQLLVSCRGAYSGKPNISPDHCYVTSNSLVLESSWNFLDLKYFYYALTIADKTKIVTGSAQPQVTTTNLEPFHVPLPPLAEQHRIVAKVDELMALCDQLEQQQEDSARTHGTLVQTLLAALTAASERGQFKQAWQCIESHFDTLFTTESSINQLKQTILQLAVMGKLVEQDPADGSAPTVSMEKLVGRKNLKNGVSLSPINGPSDFVCLPLSAMKGDTVDCSYGKPIEIEPVRAEPFLIKECDVFIIRGNGSKERVGVAGMARSCPANVLFPDLFIRVPLPVAKIDSNYFLIAWNSAATRAKLESLATTTSGIWKVNQGHISECEIPLPPLAEQHRIVAKVDELLGFCDRLKASLQIAQATQLQLADTLVGAAIR